MRSDSQCYQSVPRALARGILGTDVHHQHHINIQEFNLAGFGRNQGRARARERCFNIRSTGVDVCVAQHAAPEPKTGIPRAPYRLVRTYRRFDAVIYLCLRALLDPNTPPLFASAY